MTMKIAITGGHHNSALTIAKRLSDRGIKIIWLGHKYSSLRDRNESAEYIEVTESGFEFFDLKAGKFSGLTSLNQLLRTPAGIIHAYSILKKHKVNLVLSFGSYLGATAAISARLLNIPVFIHEQTSLIGKANKLASRFALRIYLTWPQSQKYFDQSKTKLVGLPLRESILEPKKSKLFNNSNPTLLIMGGKQGSHFINTLVLSNIDELLSSYNIILQTGASSETNDFSRAVNIKESLAEHLESRFRVYGYISETDIGDLIHSSDLVISRSGAHTVYELALLKKKCILIPFAHTHMREQLANARILKSTGQATVLPQSRTSFKDLEIAIKKMVKTTEFTPTHVPRNAGKIITSDIIKFLKK